MRLQGKGHIEISPVGLARLVVYVQHRHLGATKTCYPFAARIIILSIPPVLCCTCDNLAERMLVWRTRYP